MLQFSFQQLSLSLSVLADQFFWSQKYFPAWSTVGLVTCLICITSVKVPTLDNRYKHFEHSYLELWQKFMRVFGYSFCLGDKISSGISNGLQFSIFFNPSDHCLIISIRKETRSLLLKVHVFTIIRQTVMNYIPIHQYLFTHTDESKQRNLSSKLISKCQS